MVDIIIIAVILLIIGGASAYIIRAKKNGQRCIGCPDSKTCGHNSSHSSAEGGCGCGCNGCSSAESCQNKNK